MKLKWSKAVAAARHRRQPLVALETSVVAQGLPRPQNLEAAQACQQAVRQAGAVPATIALLNGQVCVGLSDTELKHLSSGEAGLMKLGGRDLAEACASGRSGGTTVSATCEIAAAAGIRVFATGGIGGVHRGEMLDVSQDLYALARFPVAVVCAGAKSVLDLPRTLETLEALGVPVVGVGTSELPGFYTRETGLPLDSQVADAREGARWMRARFDQLKQGGILFVVPPPALTALSRAAVEVPLAKALEAAAREGVRGKAVTPYLLSALARATAGKSLAANLALLENNAAFAGALAVAATSVYR